MKKDAYYFPHFCNARNDSKIIKLRRVLGIEGYGIYFMLLEILREQTDFKYPLAGIEDLSYEWHTSKEKIATVINDFGLFEIVDNDFFSAKLMFYLQPYIEKSERARLAAKKRWDTVNAKAYAKALQMHNISDANVLPEQCKSECKESKVKKSKKINIYIPEFSEFKDYAISNKPNVDLNLLELKYKAWKENGWKNGNNKEIKNWKTSLLNTLPYIDESKANKSKSLLGY